MAKKTTKKKKAKKKGAKKKGKKAAGKQVTHVYYECQTNSQGTTSCLESIHQASVGHGGSVVVLSAIDTDVTLDFGKHSGSPFKGGKPTISIKANKSKHVAVDSAAFGVYAYDLSCSACSGLRPPGPPEMIVP